MITNFGLIAIWSPYIKTTEKMNNAISVLMSIAVMNCHRANYVVVSITDVHQCCVPLNWVIYVPGWCNAL